MRKAKGIALAALLMIAAGCAGKSDVVAAGAPAAVGSSAPAFSLEDQTGRTVNLSDFAGQIVVLEWVNPDCPFVRRHAAAKTMRTLAEKYRDKGVVWLGVNSTATATQSVNAKWVGDHALSYPVLDDHAGTVGLSYGAKTTPHMFVIDGSGKLAYAGGIDDDPDGTKGASAVNYVDRALEALTSGRSVEVAQSRPYGCSVKYRS